MGILTGSTPRSDVLHSDLDDAIFAADFGDLISGRAPDVYGNASTFFGNTYPTQQLKKIVEVVFERLANPAEAGAMVRLSTGFGGGKTHTLMSLWHLARNIGNASVGHELLPAAGRPPRITVAAVDGHKAGVPIFAEHGTSRTRSLWGELAWQVAGDDGLRALAEVDDPEMQPTDTMFANLLPPGPVLILLDELVVYMATLSERGKGNVQSFLQKLMSICANRPQTVLVVSDPAGQAAYAREAARLGEAVSTEFAVAQQLDELLGRRMSDYDPIGDESAHVIVRRLFERVDPAAAQRASATYHSLYERVRRDDPNALPQETARQDYAQRIVDCYPFHPRLVRTAQERLAAMGDFQKSRGTLRLFARIIRSVWGAREDLELVTAGDIDWSDPSIRGELLNRLNRDAFISAVQSDVESHAGELDAGDPRGHHRRVASALLLESLPLGENAGMDDADLTLAVLRPEDAGPEPLDAMARLSGVCWHTYPRPGGRGWVFRYEPNVVKQIEERMTQVPREDARQRVLSIAQSYFNGTHFQPSAFPRSPAQVGETARLTLVITDSAEIARSVTAFSDPDEQMPRLFTNAIFAVAPSQSALDDAIGRARRLMAAELINRELGNTASDRIAKEQVKKLLEDYTRQLRIQACRAFDTVIVQGGNRKLTEAYMVPSDSVLGNVQGIGQANLLKYLQEHDLVYLDSQALDSERLSSLLSGATPAPGQPEVWTARAVHERLLGAPDLRLIPGDGFVRRSLTRAVEQRALVVRLPNGDVYDASGRVSGPDDRRVRTSGSRLEGLRLEDTVLIARVNTAPAITWTAESPVVGPGIEETDIGTGGGNAPPPPGPPRPSMEVSAKTWERAAEHAEVRPLRHVRLRANNPSVAQALAPPSSISTIGFNRFSIR